MSNNVNLNMFRTSGRPSIVKVFTYKEGDPFILPDGSHILYSEYITTEDSIEIWAAVPDDSIIHSGPLHSELRQPERGLDINGNPRKAAPRPIPEIEELEEGVFRFKEES